MESVTIFTALANVMNEVTAVAKGDSSGQGYSFRGIDAVLTAVAPALRRHGVVVVPVVEGVEYATVEIGQRRTPMIQCRATVTYQWYGPAGDHVESRVVAEAMDSGDKATSKAMSIAFRTWARLGELAEQWDRAHALYWVLLNGNLLGHNVATYPRARPYTQWRYPLRLLGVPTPGALLLAAAAARKAEPGLYPWEVAVARYKAANGVDDTPMTQVSEFAAWAGASQYPPLPAA